MRVPTTLLTLLFLSIVTVAFPHSEDDELNFSIAINKAVHQRMLTQRIALNAIAVNMNIDTDLHTQELKENILLFSKQLDELKSHTSNQTFNQVISQISAKWELYKQHASGLLTDKDITYIIEHNTELLEDCDQLIAEIVTETTVTSSKTSTLITTSSYQHMLSQRITLYSLAYRKGINQTACKERLNQSIRGFRTTLNQLQKTSINTPEIDALLDKQEVMINKMENYINGINNLDLFQIIMTSNLFISDAESLVKAYKDLNKAK